MPYCSQCGSQVRSEDRFCSQCGAPVNTAKAAEGPPEPEGPSPFEERTREFSQRAQTAYRKAMDTTDHTADYTVEDISENSGFALLSYLGLFLIVPLIGARDSRFARFHVNQGLCLFLAIALYSILLSVMLALVQWVPVLSDAFRTIYVVLQWAGIAAAVLLAALGIWNANHGLARDLPLVGSFRLFRTEPKED